MARRSKAILQLTQSGWAKWSDQRIADAVKIEKLYRTQGHLVKQLLSEYGCTCDPLITMEAGEHGGPAKSTPSLTHSLDCEHTGT